MKRTLPILALAVMALAARGQYGAQPELQARFVAETRR